MEFDAYLHGALLQERVDLGIAVEPTLDCAALNATLESAGAAKSVLCTGLAATTLVVGLGTIPVRSVMASDASTAEISMVQGLLAKRGFDPGEIDGVKGKATTEAIAKAQTYYGLAVDGILGSQTLAALQADTYDVGGSSTPLAPEVNTNISSSSTTDLQSLLSSRGFYQGAIDGIKGPMTNAAILQAQSFYRLEVDGIAGSRTIAALQADSYTPSGGSNPATAPVVNVNSSSTADLQTLLSTRGFYRGAIDGIQGSQTTAAILEAQRFYGLEVDGIAGSKTRSALERDGSFKPPTPTPPPTASNGGEIKPAPTGTTGTTGEVKPPTPTTPTSTAPNGMSTADVIALQQLLAERHFYDGPIDGIYGAQTILSVKDAQRFHDLPEDGIAGATTIAALRV
jgi:peptidoglycan hydrolase-like protein with peptidoglycan-binding domain